MSRRRTILAGAAAILSPFVLSGFSMAQSDPRVADLVKAGKVRAGIGLTPLAIAKEPSTGEMRGVALDLGHALAAKIGVELQPVIYPRPGAVIDGLRAQEWDVAISLWR
jgi:ABC-type amino acid transport substrate-binding protein